MDEKAKIPNGRIAIWVIAGGVGLYLLVSGLAGVLSG